MDSGGVGGRTIAGGAERAEARALTGWRSWFKRGGGPDRHAEILKGEGRFGWLFTAPALIGLIVFLVLPIIFTVWVSFTNWNGLVPPFDAEGVGLENYRVTLLEQGIRQEDFAIALRNNLYFVLAVVPIQTIIAFVLAVIVNQKFLKGKGFFRTSYYFPSITSSIAVSLIFIFLFQVNGVVNAILPIPDINWLDNANGIFHLILGAFGMTEPPAWLADTDFMSLSLWEWIAGPSITWISIMILVIWTTIGTFMLIFLAGLQNVSPSLEEAAAVDGASGFQRFRSITVPLMRPIIFFVLTLGVIGTWQVFDQVFAISAGGPQKTTVTPAYLIFTSAFRDSRAGAAAAIAVILFLIIIFFTLIQRRITREED